MKLTAEKIGKCVDILRSFGARRIILFGGALEAPETARDLDLAVEGLEGRTFFRAGSIAERELDVPLDLIPLDPPTPFSLYVERTGKVLHDERRSA